MYKLLKALLIIIWIIDICNIDFIINGTHIAEFLDKTIPINTLFWILLWLLLPSSNYMVNIKKGE